MLDVRDDANRPRALKVLAVGGDEALLRAEFGRLSRLEHPNLVAVHDLGRLERALDIEGRELPVGALYLVLDRVDGSAPAHVLAGLPVADRDAWLRSIADELAAALEHLHGHGLVHHDVKPDNLLIDRGGRAVLIDLGLAARPGAELRARGTLAYMAPEALVRGGDARVDLYGLGATLYELAEGAPPFADAGRGAELVRAILERPPSRPRASWLREETAALILRLLDKDPLQRLASARGVRAELARIRGDHDTAAELSASGALLPPAFCGRGAAAAQLLEVIVDPGSRRAIGVAGQAGCGKSRLIAEVLRRQRLRFAAGRGPAIDVIEGDLRALLDAEVAAEGLDDVATAVLDRLEGRARQRRQLLLLGHLERDPLALRVVRLLVCGEGVEGVLALFEGDASEIGALGPAATLQIDLEPLELDSSEALIGSMLGRAAPAGLARRLHELSVGNAAVLVEAVRAWASGGDRELARLGRESPALTTLLSRARQRVSGSERRIADALALWGEEVALEKLATMADDDAGADWAALFALTRLGLVALEEGRLRMPSQAHYGAWREAMPRSLRRALSLRLAAVAEPIRRGELLASALAAEGRGAKASEAEWEAITQAADRLERRHELPRARALLEQARRLAVGRDDLRAALELRIARLYVRTARYDDALALLPAERAGGEARLLRAEALQRRGDYDAAGDELRSLLEGRGDVAKGEVQQARVLLGRLLLRRGEPQEALTICQEAAEGVRRVLEGEASGDLAGPCDELRPSEAGLLEVCGLARLYLGQLEAADALFKLGNEALRHTPRRALRARFRSMRGMVAFTRGELAEAADHYQAALLSAQQAGDAHAVATYRGNLGSTQLELGEYRQALSQLARAVRELSRLARNSELASVLHNLGGLMLLLGDLPRVEQLRRRAAGLAEQLGSRHVHGFVELLAGDLARRRGEHSAALEAYGRASCAFREVAAEREALLAQLHTAEALLDLGRVDRAAQLLDDLPAPKEDQRGEFALVRGRVVAADPSASAEQVHQASTDLARACATLEARGALSKLWRAAAVLGSLLATRGRRGAAIATLRRAHAQLEELMSKTPDLYRGSLASDPDARALEEQWQSLVEVGAAKDASAHGPVGDSRPGWQPDEHRLRRLLTINKRLNSELRLPNLLELIVDSVIELTDAERGFLILVDPPDDEGDESRLSIKLARNIDRRSLDGDELALSRSIAERAAQSGQPVVTFDALDDERFQSALSVSDLSLRSVLAVPLRVKGRVVGTIYVDHRLRRGAFGEPEVALVQDFADQAAIAIDNARLLAENEARRREIEQLNAALESKVESQAAELLSVREELRSSKQAAALRYSYDNIIGRTPRMLELFELLDRVTDTKLPVVVQGESGTGKELVARAIHYNGPRAKRAFVSENCGAIPETLLESVLFGAVRGAYTGANRDRRGLFEVADGGTLFLDEVGEMSAGMQTKLLRVLQDGELRPVGGERSVRVDVRVIAASNRDLRKLIEAGAFREDLFYRLNVIRVEIPALRDRREDIPLLIEHFLEKHSTTRRRVDNGALARLMGYSWPGNVRELENEVMRLVALADEVISAADLSPQIGGGAPLRLENADDLRLKPRMEHLERELIKRALERTGGNQSQAAKLLGLSRYGLLKKLKRLHPERYE